MQVGEGKVTRFHYQIFDDEGNEVESSLNDVPYAFLYGKGNVMQGVEDALSGKNIGEIVDVTLEPRDAYGIRKEDAIKKIPIKHLAMRPKRLSPGALVRVQTDQGIVDASIIKAGKFMITVDMNHPFSGKTLHFKVEVVDIRDATDEELAHGHAHGEGGHQH